MFTTFRGGQSGAWRVTSSSRRSRARRCRRCRRCRSCIPQSIALPILPSQTSWRLAGVASHVRYTERAEKEQLVAVQAGLGRPEATCAALIPIRKSAAWWELTQEERRRDLRGQVAPHRRQPEISAGDRAPALSLPRSRRALRFPDLVRIRARSMRAVRGTGRHAARTEEWTLCRARGGYRCAWLDARITVCDCGLTRQRYFSRNVPEAIRGRPVTGQL